MATTYTGAYNFDYIKLLPRYQTIRDCINDDVVYGYTDYCKYNNSITKHQEYLVRTPGMSDETYAILKQLGRYLNVTGATLEGMLGGVWRVDPTIVLPESVEYLNENADGEGNSLMALMKDQVGDTLPFGRYGLLVEPPQATLNNAGDIVEVSKADVNSGRVTTTIKPYVPESIYDWETAVIDGVRKLSLVKLIEEKQVRTASYTIECSEIYRFLTLDETGYYQQVFQDPEGTSPLTERVAVLDYNGASMTEIPFYFSGSRNNDSTADNPPFYKLADANIAHYNNDANNRLNLLIHATGTLVVTGTASDLKGKTINLGGGNGIYLGESGSANLLQLEAGTALPEALKADLDNMVLLGAKLNEPSVQRTFGEASLSASQETALLSDVVANCEEAMNKAVNMVIMLQTGQEQDFEIGINRQFFPVPMNAQDRAQWVMEIQQGLASPFEFWEAKRKAGLTSKTDKQIQMELSGEQPLNFEDNDNADQSDSE